MGETRRFDPSEGASPVRWCGFRVGEESFRLAASPLGVCRVALPEEEARAFFRSLACSLPGVPIVEDAAGLAPFVDDLRARLAGERREPADGLHLLGSAFQRAVWEEVRKVPFGATTTYGEIARRVGNARASRAVGAALAANPLPILVPGHRVLASDGSMPGYGPGVSLKERLLRIEGIVPKRAAGERGDGASVAAASSGP